MRKQAIGGVLTAMLALSTAGQAGPAQSVAPAQTSQREIVKKYCITCHNQRLKTGGLVLEGMDMSVLDGPSAVSANDAATWEKVVRKLRAGAMPPAGLPRPKPAEQKELVARLETNLDHAEVATPNPGRPALHRLNRAEYANAIRDLLGLEVDTAALLPPDDSAYGFDNISDALGLSPALQEHYLSAALKIGALAVGDTHVTPGSETFRIRQDLSQNEHVEGMPLGTIGGTRIVYNFPLDAEYVLQAKLFRTNLNIMRGLETEHQVEFTVDGQRVRLASIGGNKDLASLFEQPTDTGDAVDARLRVRLPLKAGPHVITVAFLQGAQVADIDRLQPYIRSSVDNFDWAGRPHLQTIAVTGPFNVTGPGDTPSRRRIFSCRPATVTADLPCARQILSTLARRAYRQPVSENDLQRVMAFYEKARKSGNFDSGIEAGLQRILASPRFVFRIETDPAKIQPGKPYRLSDVELASRLSFFLWSSIPDDELMTLASQGKLKDPAVLEQQVRRMLADKKSESLVDNFAGQWLHLRNVRNLLPNSDLFPDFDDNLRQSFKRETELFFESIIREDRSVMDLMTADYTFVNERLARHYGIPDIYGSRFRRVTITDDARRGLLGQGSILATTSHAERTSPVVRGKWILENILGLPVPPPPPDVPPLKEIADGAKPKSMREQMAEHRANPACAVCHKAMDPIGFALENFDAVGAWRSTEAGGAIDASGVLSDGTKVNGVVDLRQALVHNPEVFAGTLTEKLMIYALGRGLDYHDMPVLRAILRDGAKNDYKFSALILGIVRSTPFQMRMPPENTGATVQAASR